jgi:signal transduction histidine kinase/tetratricopeptide (TPR) repeat protein
MTFFTLAFLNLLYCMKYILLMVAGFFLSKGPMQAQESINSDSLLSLLGNAKDDTNKVKVLLDLGKYYFTEDLDSALFYMVQCNQLIGKIKDSSRQYQCLHEFVRIYHTKSDYRNALQFCLKAISISRLEKNRYHEANSTRAISTLYHNLRMNDSAVKYGVYALKLTEEIGDTINVAYNYGNLCWLYQDIGQNDKSIFYGNKGVAAGERYKDTSGMLISMNNLALCYLRMSDYPKAIEWLNKQLTIAQKNKRKRSVRKALINLATVYFDMGDKVKLKQTTEQMNAFILEEGKIELKDMCNQAIINGYNFIFQKEFVKAEEALLSGLKMAEADSIMDPLQTIYSTLIKVNYARQNFIEGNYYEQKLDALNQLVNEQELSEYALDLETKYNTEKKEAQIKLQQTQLKQRNVLIYLLAGIALLVLTIGLLIYRNYLNKQRLQQQRIYKLETEKKLTATEAVLKGEEQERTRLAKDLHDGLGGMLSGIKYSMNNMKGNLVLTPENAQAFERSMDMLDSSIREMRRVAHNMMPEALVKFGLDDALNDFCNDINQSGALLISYQSIGLDNVEIDQTTAITVYRIVQELINNTMKHAEAKNAIVQVSKTENRLTVTIEDDGKGFDTAILDRTKGIGWGNIQNRIEFLKGTLDVQSGKDQGTSVHIEFDLQ